MELTHLVVWQYYEGAAARRLHNDGQELGVHCTERRVPRTLGYSDVIIALLPLQGLPVNVAEL